MITYRYPGIKPFQALDKNVFYGRKQDTEKLFKLISVEKTVLLYSKSGLGKSSLLNAGIIPLVETETNYQPLTMRFYAYQNESSISPVEKLLAKLRSLNKVNVFLDSFSENNSMLWLAAKTNQLQNEDRNLMLIFDQFEELFTYPESMVLDFKKQFSELLFTSIPAYLREKIKTEKNLFDRDQVEQLHRPMNIKCVFSIRSDKMSQLNQMADYLPNIQQIFYELKPLNALQAKEAIVTPAQKEGEFITPSFEYKADALEAILNYLTQNGKRNIETFQLQMICQHCEKLVQKGSVREITVQTVDKLENLFNDYYENAIASIEIPEDQTAARIFVEDQLIVEERRISIDKVLCIRSVKEEVIDKLVESRILRAEPNTTGGISYELSHDTLIAPILKSRNQRLESEREIERLEELRIAKENAEKIKQEREKELKQLRRTRILLGLASLMLIVTLYVLVLDRKKSMMLSIALVQAENAESIADANQRKALASSKATAELLKFIAGDIGGNTADPYTILKEKGKKEYYNGNYLKSLNYLKIAKMLNPDAKGKEIDSIQTLASKLFSLRQKADTLMKTNRTAAIDTLRRIVEINKSDKITRSQINSATGEDLLLSPTNINKLKQTTQRLFRQIRK